MVSCGGHRRRDALTAAAALHLAPEPGALRVSLFPTTPVQGEIRVALPGAAPIAKPVNINPAQPFSEAIPLPGAHQPVARSR